MIVRFTAYRRNLSERGTHSTAQANPDDQPQYEGVVFSDGTCVLKWLTASKSVSVFNSLADMLQIHGHPEYGTEIEWHDGTMPEEWAQQLVKHAEHQQAELIGNGLASVEVVEERDADGVLVGIRLETPKRHFTKQIYPVPHD